MSGIEQSGFAPGTPAWLGVGTPILRWTRTEIVTAGLIMALALVLRAACCVAVPSPLESDYLGYWEIANNLYAGRGLLLGDGQPTAFLSLGYPIFLAGVFLILGPTVAAVKIANVVLGTVSVFLLYLVARRLFGSRLVAALAALAAAVYLELVVYTAYVAKENLMIFLVLAQLAIVTRPRPTLAGAVPFGLVTGALALAGNAALAMMPGLIWQVFLSRRQLGWAASYLAIAAVCAMAVMAPISWRNHQVFGGWNINNNAGFNLYIGNNPTATPFFESITETPIAPRWQKLHDELGERGADLILREMAVQYIVSHPVETLQLSLRKAVAFWWPSFHEGKGPEGAAVQVIRLVSVCQYILLCLLFLLSLRSLWPYRQQMAVLWLMVLGYTAVHMMFYIIYRYRLPIIPVLCIGAGVAVAGLLPQRWAARG